VDAECISLAGAVSTSVNSDENLGIRVGMSNDEVERILTLATLDHYGEKKRTAEVLGISPRTLRYKIAKLRDAGVNLDDDLGAQVAG